MAKKDRVKVGVGGQMELDGFCAVISGCGVVPMWRAALLWDQERAYSKAGFDRGVELRKVERFIEYRLNKKNRDGGK